MEDVGKLKLVLVFIAIIIVLGGCQMSNENPSAQPEEELKPADMDEEDLPDVRAFKDEFTRGFLQSTEETRPGYYPFLSATGAYKMDFPAEGKVGEESYSNKDNGYEGIMVAVGNETSNITHTLKIEYFSHLKENTHKDTRLDMLQSTIGEDLEYDKVEKEKHTLYISPYQRDKEDFTKKIYGYGVFIFNNNGPGGIKVVYTSRCAENCEELKEADMQGAYDWVKSVQFTDKPKESDKDER